VTLAAVAGTLVPEHMSSDETYPLAERLAGLGVDWVPPIEGREAEVQAALRTAWAMARSEWPGVELTDREFVEHLGALLAPEEDPVSTLSQLRLGEVYLCAACVRGIDGAAEAFEDAYMVVIREALSRIRIAGHTREELAQKLRVQLLTGDSEKPAKVSSFSGRGPLGRWLKVTASRAALMLLRHEGVKQKFAAAELVEKFGETADPELVEIKRLYRPQFIAAMTQAFDELSSEQRALLRESMVPGRTMDALAQDFEVDKSTVSRWLKRIRSQIFEGTRRHLQDACGMGDSECLSIMRVVQSGLDVSLDRLLATRSE